MVAGFAVSGGTRVFRGPVEDGSDDHVTHFCHGKAEEKLGGYWAGRLRCALVRMWIDEGRS